MTNEQAIKNIVAYMYYEEDIPEEVGKAFDVAVKALKERPQGEWIKLTDKYGDSVRCPFCNKEIAGTDLNFCVKCGADLRGK